MVGHRRECRAWSSLFTTTAADCRIAIRAEVSTAPITAGLTRDGLSHRSMWYVVTTGVGAQSRAMGPASSMGMCRLATRDARATCPATNGSDRLTGPRLIVVTTGQRKISTPLRRSRRGRDRLCWEATTATRHPRPASPSAISLAESVRPLT